MLIPQQIKESINTLELRKQKFRLPDMQEYKIVKNLSQLKGLLDQKNKKFRYNKLSVERSVCQMDILGANIQKLESNIRINKKQIDTKQESENYMNLYTVKLKNLKHDKVSAYIEENIRKTIIQNICDSNFKLSLNQKIIDKAIERFQRRRQSNITINSKNSQKQIYQQIVLNTISDGKYQGIQLLRQFANKSTNPIWKILSFQLKDLENIKKDQVKKLKKKIILNTIENIEKQFRENIPNSKQELNDYVMIRYRQIIKNNQVQKDSNNHYIWGIVYVLFRCGKYIEIQKMLSNGYLATNFQKREKFLYDLQRYDKLFKEITNQNDPQEPQIFQNSQTDYFLQQIYQIFNQQKQLQEGFLTNQLTLIWYVLRISRFINPTTADYLKDAQIDLNNQLKKKFKLESVLNLFLILAYDKIFLLVNQLITRQEIIHLTILFWKFGLINLQFIQKATLGYLQKQFLYYSKGLLMINKTISLKYLLIIPKLVKLQNIRKFIISNNVIDCFFGFKNTENLCHQSLKKHYKADQYNNFIQAICKQIEKSKPQTAIQIYNKILKNQIATIQFLINNSINSILNNKSKEVIQTLDQIYTRYSNISRQYLNICQFIYFYYKLSEVVQTKNANKIKTFLLNQYCNLTDFQSQPLRSIIGYLIQVQYVEFFLNYIKLLEISLEISCSYSNIDYQSNKFLQKIQNIQNYLQKLKKLIKDKMQGSQNIQYFNKTIKAIDALASQTLQYQQLYK